MAWRAPASVEAAGRDGAGLAADVRDQLRLWCQDQGLLGELRAFLRHRLVTLTAGCGGPPAPPPSPLALLAADLLRHQGLWFSLAVLTAESGLTRPGPPQTRLSATEVHQVIQELGYVAGHDLYERYSAGDQPLVAMLLQRGEPAYPTPPVPSTPSHPPPENRFTVSAQDAEPITLELQLLQCRRRANERAQEQYSRQLGAFKADQLRQVKEQERARYQRKLTAMREEMQGKCDLNCETERRKSAAEKDALLARLSQERAQLRDKADSLRTSCVRADLTDTNAYVSQASQCSDLDQSAQNTTAHCSKSSQTDLAADVVNTIATPPKRPKMNVTFDVTEDEPAQTESGSPGTTFHSINTQASPPVTANRASTSAVSECSDASSCGPFRDDQFYPPVGHRKASTQTQHPMPTPQHPPVMVSRSARSSQLPVCSSDHSPPPHQPPKVSGSRPSEYASRLSSAAAGYEALKNKLMGDLERRVAEVESSRLTSRSGSQFSSPERPLGDRNQPKMPEPHHPRMATKRPVAQHKEVGCCAASERQRLLLESLMERSSELEEQIHALQLLAERSRSPGWVQSERPLATSPHPSQLPPPSPQVELPEWTSLHADQQPELTTFVTATRRRLGTMSAAASRLSRQFRDIQTDRQRSEMDRVLRDLKAQSFEDRAAGSQPPYGRVPQKSDGSHTAEAKQPLGRQKVWPEHSDAALSLRDSRIEAVLQRSRMTVAADSNPGPTRHHPSTENARAGTRPTRLGVESRSSIDKSVPEKRERVYLQPEGYDGIGLLPSRSIPERDPIGVSATSKHFASVSRSAGIAGHEQAPLRDFDRPSREFARSMHSSSPGRSRLFGLLRDSQVSEAEQPAAGDSSVRRQSHGAEKAQAYRDDAEPNRESVVSRLASDRPSAGSDLSTVRFQNMESETGKKLESRLSLESFERTSLEKKAASIVSKVSQSVITKELTQENLESITHESLKRDAEGSQQPKLSKSDVNFDLESQRKPSSDMDYHHRADVDPYRQSEPTVDLDAQWKSPVDLDAQWKPAADLDAQRKPAVDLDAQWKSPAVDLDAQRKPAVDLDAQWKPAVDLDAQSKPSVDMDAQSKPAVDLDAQWKSPAVDLDAQWKPKVDRDSNRKTAAEPSASDDRTHGRSVAEDATTPVKSSTSEEQPSPPRRTSASAPPAASAPSAVDPNGAEEPASAHKVVTDPTGPSDEHISAGENRTSSEIAGGRSPEAVTPAEPAGRGAVGGTSSPENGGLLANVSWKDLGLPGAGSAVDTSDREASRTPAPVGVSSPDRARGEDGHVMAAQSPSPGHTERSRSEVSISGATAGGGSADDDFWG